MHQARSASRNLLQWSPRILSILYAVFLGLFAFDSVGIGFIFQLLPAVIVLAILILAWKKSLLGGICYLLFGLSYILLVGLNRPLSWYLIISGPAVVMGTLFLVQNRFNRDLY